MRRRADDYNLRKPRERDHLATQVKERWRKLGPIGITVDSTGRLQTLNANVSLQVLDALEAAKRSH